MTCKKQITKLSINESVIKRLDVLKEKYERSYSEVIKQLLLDTNNWTLNKK